MTQSRLGLSSKDLPGIIAAQLLGNAGLAPGFEDEGPDGDISEQFTQLQNHDYVVRYAAVPAITVPNPFNTTTVLQGIQKQTQAWVGLQLLNSTLSSQFDRLFQAAIDAAGRNDSKGVNAHLAELRKLLRNEHHDIDSDRDANKDGNGKKRQALIDKLAARVLDFDLKYIRKRLGGDDD